MLTRTLLCLALVIFPAAHDALAQQQSPSGPAPGTTDGQAIFLQRCSHCHGPIGEGVSAAITIAGPNIQAEHDPGRILAAEEIGPSHMPKFGRVLSVAEMRAVADYVSQHLAVIPLGGGNAGEGGELYRRNCAPCHRTAVRGGVLAYAGVNPPNLVGYSAPLIAGAIRWGPGPMPQFPPSILNDRQLNSIVDYVQSVQHPPRLGGSALHWYGPVAEGFAAWVILAVLIGLTVWIEWGGKG